MRGKWLPVPHFRQEAENTCVAACVRMVLKYHGKDVAESELVALLGTSFRGTLFSAFERVADLGFEVSIREGKPLDLFGIRDTCLPLIVSVDSFLLPNHPPPGGAHAVVVAGATTHQVALLDPDRPGDPSFVRTEVFMKAWAQRDYRMAQLKPTIPHEFE